MMLGDLNRFWKILYILLCQDLILRDVLTSSHNIMCNINKQD